MEDASIETVIEEWPLEGIGLNRVTDLAPGPLIRGRIIRHGNDLTPYREGRTHDGKLVKHDPTYGHLPLEVGDVVVGRDGKEYIVTREDVYWGYVSVFIYRSDWGEVLHKPVFIRPYTKYRGTDDDGTPNNFWYSLVG
ncbi:hypothetical protein GF420_15795 [candidate division GN15 bacterium]|nr:hypothetical protein [candidate division GN15 bacterium]